MKVLLLVISIILFLYSNAFAQNLPIAGQFKLHIIAVNQEIDVEINNDIWIFSLINGNKFYETVTIDNDRKTIVIPFLIEFADYFYFENKGNYIDLRGGGNLNMPLQEMLLYSFRNIQGINSITDEFIEKLNTVMETFFLNTPIMRLYPN